MILTHLTLQNFRSYTKMDFTFSNDLTIIIGPNTAGKTNLVESITLIAKGKTTRSEKEAQSVRFDSEIARVRGKIGNQETDVEVEVVLTNGMVANVAAPLRRFLINGVPKRRVDFASHIAVVSFSPNDVDIVIGSPSLRRAFLDDALEQVDRQYRVACITYTKALRQRNALLDRARDTGIRNEQLFSYWDDLLITHGNYITKARESLITYINETQQDVFSLRVTYDHSIVSKDRLLQYKTAELGSAVTLVGPHRDDFFIEIVVGSVKQNNWRNVKAYGSRGQQRLVILQLKMLQLAFMEEKNGTRPLLLLDDIFSELDNAHIGLVQSLLDKQQTIMTTTHKEFVTDKILHQAEIIELERT